MTPQEVAQLMHTAHAVSADLARIADQLARIADIAQQRLSLDKIVAQGLYPAEPNRD